ncbi:MAG TPA: L,D-transpeptidase family protein, partial [Burkholderiales bacterium]|nr:L,D-transpeptidase family protein [Burkholderiales bacterium]
KNGNPVEGDYEKGMRVTQPPGPDNALGQYKFDMPNDHAVYLHDTPAKEKFEKEVRAFSSGCIRLEKARELAQLLLGEQHQMSAQQIDEVIATNETKTIALAQKIPVLILYFTAEAGESGVTFRPDIYERDGKLAAALKAPYELNAMLKMKKPA